MGKKKVVQKSETETIKESEKAETAVKMKGAVSRTKLEKGFIYVQASYNNTLVTVTDNKGNVLTWLSAGSLGFSGPKKATPFAASKVAEAILEKIQKSGPTTVEVLVKGVGAGRDAVLRTLAARNLDIVSIKDVTPIPHNGPRPKKARRV
jgi:small subunit ribosomal protein S11